MHLQRIDAALARIDLSQHSYALISEDGAYRYWLHRTWFTGKGWTVFLMLNPSTADQFQNDPTVRRCVGFAQLWGSRGVAIVNVFAARSTDAGVLHSLPDPVGPENELFIRVACRLSSRVVCAWGAHEFAHKRRQRIVQIIREMNAMPVCLGLTRSGNPQHPLYVPAAKELESYRG